MTDTGYQLFVRGTPEEQWRHYGHRDSEPAAQAALRSLLEDGDAAFYVQTEDSLLEDWDIDVNPNA